MIQLPQVKTLSRQGTFLSYVMDGTSSPSSILRVKSNLHVTNLGTTKVEFTVRMLADSTKVGSSVIKEINPEQEVVFSLDDWYNKIEVLANGVKVPVMLRGTSTQQFGAYIGTAGPRAGSIDTETAPFDYPTQAP